MADRSVVYRLIADASGVLAGTRQASASVRKLGDDITKSGAGAEKMRRGFDEVGKTAGRVGLVAAAALGVMLAKAANFEQAVSNIAAATHETEENMRLLRDAALDAGASTAFSATEAADAITELAKAGVATADILGKNGALNGALSLAAAGQLEVADAAEFTATALTQFQLPGKQATHVADLLAAGAGRAQGEVTDMANALKYAGVPASNLGVSIEETAGALALFAKNGIIGEQAGTSLRGMLSSLTSPSKIAKKTLDDLGISMFNNQGKFIGLAGVADQLRGRMETLTDEERSLALGRIFGNEQLQAANVLYREGGDGVREWTRNVNDAGFAAETAAIKTDNLRGDLERLGGAIDTALIKGGTGGQGFLRGLTQGATGAVDAFNKLPPVFSNTVTGMLAVTAITGGGLWFGTKVIRGVADTREALENLGPAGVKAGRAMKTVSAAAAGFTVLLVAAEGIKAIQRATDEALPSLDTMTKQLLDLRSGDVASLGAEFDSLGDSLNRIAESDFKINPLSGPEGNFSDFLQTPFEGIFGEAGSLRQARAEIDLLDQGLANLVSNGRPDAAAEALSAIAQSSGLTSEQLSELRSNLPGYQSALDGMATDATLAADAHEGMGKKVKIAGQAVKFTEEQIKEATDAYADARAEAKGVADSFLDISTNADKAKVSLGEWIRQQEEQVLALEQFTANSKRAAERGLAPGFIAKLKELGTGGALRMKQLANASEEEIERINRAFKRGERAAEEYQDMVAKPNELRTDLVVIDSPALRAMRRAKQVFAAHPKSLNTELKVDNRQAFAGIRAVEARLARLMEAKVIKIRLEQQDVRTGSPGFAGGGYTGHGAKFDVAGLVHRGEFVFDAETTRRHRALFEAIHRGASSNNAQGYAQGGYVGGGAAGGLSQGDVSLLLAGMSQMRPLWNNANINVQDGEALLRQASADRRAAAGDGVRRFRP